MIEYMSNTDMLLFIGALILLFFALIVCVVTPPLAFVLLFIGGPMALTYQETNYSRPLRDIEQSIIVEDSKVTIDKLPGNYTYKKLDDDKAPESNKKQVFKYEEDATFNSSFLVMENGKKYKLSEEDTKFLKERGVR